jgi:hypothetical protein
VSAATPGLATEQCTRSSTPRPPAVAPSLVGVMACIKTHESGDYQEHSHLQDGSGAFQFIPSTWRTWASERGSPRRACQGHPVATMSTRISRPAAVQDAVVAYALTHGGAGNWSPSYGKRSLHGWNQMTATMIGGYAAVALVTAWLLAKCYFNDSVDPTSDAAFSLLIGWFWPLVLALVAAYWLARLLQKLVGR